MSLAENSRCQTQHERNYSRIFQSFAQKKRFYCSTDEKEVELLLRFQWECLEWEDWNWFMKNNTEEKRKKESIDSKVHKFFVLFSPILPFTGCSFRQTKKEQLCSLLPMMFRYARRKHLSLLTIHTQSSDTANSAQNGQARGKFAKIFNRFADCLHHHRTLSH